MRRRSFLAASLSLACSSTGPPAVDATNATDAAMLLPSDATPDTAWLDTNTTPTMHACGGVWCSPGQICCYATSTCVAPGDPSCVVPSGSPPGTCASNADCAAGESCQVLDARGDPPQNRCAGLGTCWQSPGGCGGSGAICGCDGNTYSTACDAYAARVRIVSIEGGCGQPTYHEGISCNGSMPCRHGTCEAAMGICSLDDLLYACATTDQCPAGQTCCAITGLCIRPSDSALCAVAPPGTLLACGSDADCQRWDGSYWGADNMIFCDGPSCSGPGGCVYATGACDGTLAPVCGCDGRTYTNACEARLSRVRVAHTGGC